MRGVEEQRDRWKRGVTLVDNNLGDGLGQGLREKTLPTRA